jgi:AcrR family transcriptional regulator
MAKRKTQSSTRRDLVEGRILEEAAALFAERGVSGTSLQEVADALDISRTALYHYIGGKEELLETLVSGLSRTTADNLEKIAADRKLEPPEKLQAAIRDMVVRIANNPARFRLLLLSEGTLPDALASEHRKARRRSLDALLKIIREAIGSGALRPVEEHVAAFSVLGMCNWVAWWYRSDRENGLGPDQIADALAEIGLEGLRSPKDRGAPAGADAIGHAIHLLRQDLGFLEQTLDGQRAPSKSTGAPKPKRSPGRS